MSSRFIALYTLTYFGIGILSGSSQGCGGLKADAGPDQFTCDPNMPVQLMGSFNGTPTKYYWTPTTYLSDPNSTDPTVKAPPGKYTYTFNVEAISNTNLIVNGNFEAGNTGFTHDYNYGTPGGPFSPGWLSVGTDPNAYNSGFSHCGDHTTGTGNQLIVDGSTVPNSNVWCQTVSVTAGKMYLFRFYVQSVFAPAPAHLIALANGVNIGSVSAAGLCDWQTLEVCFTATSSTVKMCIQETTLIAFGNDFAIDDIEMYEKCMEKDDVVVEVVDLKAKIQVPLVPKCSDDVFDLNATGSSTGPNIRYEWRTVGGNIISENGLNAKGQGSGKYIVKVIFEDGGVICEKEAEIDVVQTEKILGSLEVQGIATCSLDTIVLKASGSGGSGNFDYQWIPSNKIISGQHNPIAYAVEAGIYKVIIIDKKSGCQLAIQNVVVADTSKPLIQLSGDSLISCKNKTISLFSTPFDTTKYNYQWLLPDSSVVKNKDSITSKSSGIYALKIIDKSNKCNTDKSIVVSIDTLRPNIELGPDQNIDCINTDVNIIPVANNPNLQINYFWTLPSGALTVENNLLNKSENKAGFVFLRLLNVINGCEASDTMQIHDLRLLPLVDAGNGAILNCKLKDYTLDGTNSKIDSSRFFWSTSNGNILSGANTLNPVVNAPGWYYLNLEDTINHCRNIDSVYINQNILTPIAKLGPDRVFTCADSILTLDGSNSSQGGQLRYNWISPNGIIDSGQGTQFIKIKSAGDYYLIVLDSINFCSDTDLISVKPDLNAPVANISVNDTLTCLQPSVMLFGTASSPSGDPVIYHWSASSGQVIQNPNSLSPIVTEPGEYLLTVIDQLNGCSTTVKDTVTIDTIKPIASTGNSGIWNCSTTQFTLDGSNSTGTHGLQFQWTTTDGSILSNNQKNRIDIGAPGTYTLKVIDLVNGCESIDQIVVQKDLNIPVASIQFPDTLNCFRSTVMLSGQGSSTGNRIQYNWNTNNGQIIGSTNQINILVDKPGTYQIIVTDTTNKCKQQQTVTVIEDKLQPVVDAGNPAILSCQLTDLILTATISTPGNHNLNWKTNQGNILSKTDSFQIKINKPGIYFVDVTNTSNGCSGTDSVLVTKINNLSVDAGSSTELTCSLLEATLNGSLQNGAGNEQFIWSTIQGHFTGNPNAAQVKADRPGWYYFIVNNNATGCNGIDSVLITENTNRPTTINLDVQQPKCPGDSWLTNITNISGGEKPLQVFLNNQLVNGLTMQGNAPGNYSIKVVDKNGCELSSGFNIITPTGVAVQLVPLVRLSAGDDYNLVPMYSIPDDSIASVQWSPSDFLTCTNCPYPQIKGIDQDLEYTVTYTNRNGCIASARIRIEIIKRNIWIPNAFSPNGDNINDSFYPVVSEDSYQEIKSMQIFDRWGNLLFSRMHFPPNDPFYGWNGDANHEHLNPGTFVYVIEVVWKNGETEKRFGNVTLIR
jgi:gliding motility-associated-like protein